MWSLEIISIYRWLKTDINKAKQYASRRERPRNFRTEIRKKNGKKVRK
jgi:hypothetical protein